MEVLKTMEILDATEVNCKNNFFKEIKPISNMNVSDACTFFDGLFQELSKQQEAYTSYEDRLKHTPSEDSELGSWEGERGESKFIPNPDSEVGSAAKNELEKYGMDGVEYKDAEPDFSECCEAEVKIDNMTENRENNFAQADAECAKKWNEAKRDGKNDWTAADVRDWRRENQYSWHECCDTSTMQLVPRDIHETCRHSGGVAECKARDAANDGGGFDA